MPGQTRFNVSTAGVDVRTTGGQTYDDPVVLMHDTVLAGANVTFAGAVNGTTAGLESLEVQSPGLTAFTGVVGGVVPLENLTTDTPGQTRLRTVSTLGDQTYNDPVLLTAVATLAGNDVRFIDTLDGAFALTVNTSGNGSTEFHDRVGGITPLASILTNADGGQTRFNIAAAGVDVRTTGSLTYNDPVVLMQDTVLAGSNVTFAGAVNGTTAGLESLEVQSPGLTTFTGVVGGTVPLENLTTDTPGQTRLHTVSTLGDQTYNDPVLLTAVATLAGNDVRFFDTLDGAFALTVNTSGNGSTEFHDLVGGNTPLASILTNADGGQTKFNIAAAGVDVRTTGDQTYNDAVVLMQDTLLVGANVTFAGTDNGTTPGLESLEVRSPGLTIFGGAVGGAVPLESLTTDMPGQTRFNVATAGVDVRTTGDQTYNDPVVLMQHTSLVSTAGRIAFVTTIDSDANGPWDLSVESAGVASFGGDVGVGRALRDLIVFTGGPFSLNVNVTAARNIDVQVRESSAASADDDLTLLAGAHLTAGGNVLLKAGDDATLVSGATIAADGTLTIDGDFGDNDPFPTTIAMTSATPMTVDAFGLLRGSAGVLIRGGNDSTDVINLQANRLASANTVAVQGYRLDAANSGSDEILLVFSPDYVMSNVGRITISGGDEAGEDRLTIDHSKDLGRRVLEISYTTVYDPSDPGFDPVNPVIDGSNATFLGLGTSLGVDVFDFEKYVLKAGNGGHDHVLIRAADQPFPATPAGAPFQNLVQVIGVSNDGFQQWRLSGWESGELQGSNVRDLIVNDTNRPMLLQGKEGNDILVGGTSVDAIFSGPGASYDNSGNPFFFTTPNAVLLPFLSNPDPAFIQTTPLAELNRAGDALIGRDGNDFLFSDIDLFRDGATLWGLVTLDEPGEADLLDGAGGATAATGQTDHAAQFGVGDIVRNITGMLIDGGGQKNVFTWLKAQIMQANLNPVTMTSGAVNMLIDAAFRANQPGKVGLLSPPFSAILDDFDIDVQPPPAAALPLSRLADGASDGEAEAGPAGLSSPWSDEADAAFATLAD
jgi:hypothetical protein